MSRVKYFRGYPDCNFSRDFHSSHFVGFGEDSVSYWPFHSGPADVGVITPGIMRDLIRCGVNEISLDRVTPDDGRLRAAALELGLRPNNPLFWGQTPKEGVIGG
jgi:hypothetical protein